MISSVQIIQITSENLTMLAEFFDYIKNEDSTKFFHPHPLTNEEASRIANHKGSDLYVALLVDSKIQGYGMLRGWDDGFTVPTLGVVIGHRMQGLGLGRLLVIALHSFAKSRGASKIMIHVYRDNIAAVTLYSSLGYKYDDDKADNLTGYKRIQG